MSLVRLWLPIWLSCNVSQVGIDLEWEVVSARQYLISFAFTYSGVLGAPMIDRNVPSPIFLPIQ